jgi:hypothetical protein
MLETLCGSFCLITVVSAVIFPFRQALPLDGKSLDQGEINKYNFV